LKVKVNLNLSLKGIKNEGPHQLILLVMLKDIYRREVLETVMTEPTIFTFNVTKDCSTSVIRYTEILYCGHNFNMPGF